VLLQALEGSKFQAAHTRDQKIARELALGTLSGIEAGLWPACTEIIRFQHNNMSSSKRYTSTFIPGLHDTCLIVEQDRKR